MEFTNVLLIFSLLLIAAAIIFVFMAIYKRNEIHYIEPPEDIKANQKIKKIRSTTQAKENQVIKAQDNQPIEQETGEEKLNTILQGIEQIIPEDAQPKTLPDTNVIKPEESDSTTRQEAEKIEKREIKPLSTSLEEIQPDLGDESQPKQSKQDIKRRRNPIYRGGRPRGPIQSQKRRTTRETASRHPKPEIVCWKRARQWFIGIEVPEELFGNREDWVIYQNGSLLPHDDSREACWLLKSISGQVMVQRIEGDAIEEVYLTFGQSGYLLFKLGGKGLNQGRLIKSVSSGSYLVAAPDSWERDELVSGASPVMPESVALDRHIAHFFYLEKDDETRIAFRTLEGKPITIPLNSVRFELVGVQLENISVGVGPLFSVPPRIRALDTQTWKEVETIVIGEAGGGRGKWRTAFSPDTNGHEQELPYEIWNKKGGWYFIRFYDGNDDLIESIDFRFLSGLKQIRMPELSPVPSRDGHKAVRVQLFHEPGITIQAIEESPNIPIECGDIQTTLTIPPIYSSDLTRWLVSYDNGPQVEVTILVERLWWSLGEEATEPTQWEDKPPVLSPDDLIATSKKALWFRFPRYRWANNILVGFELARARPYSIKVAEKTLAVPLREFSDAKEIMDDTQDHRLKVWIESDNEVMEGVVAVIPAIPVIPPLQECVGIGRYKTAVARATLQRGSGNITVNGSAIDQYFKKAPLKTRRFLRRLRELPTTSEALSQLDACVEVKGSSPNTMRQAKAVAHALARALMAYDPELNPLLKHEGFGGVKVRSMSRRRRD